MKKIVFFFALGLNLQFFLHDLSIQFHHASFELIAFPAEKSVDTLIDAEQRTLRFDSIVVLFLEVELFGEVLVFVQFRVALLQLHLQLMIRPTFIVQNLQIIVVQLSLSEESVPSAFE